MKNQSGFTVLELLAALTLSAVVIGVASLLFMSLSSQFNGTTESYIANSEKNKTVSLIGNELSQASQVVFINSELRYRRGGAYFCLYYNNHELWWYKYNESGSPSTLSTEFVNTANSPATTPAKYTNGQKLTDKLAGPPSYINASTSTAVSSTVVQGGATIQTKLQFQYTKTNANGAKQLVTNSEKMASTFSTKLIVDY